MFSILYSKFCAAAKKLRFCRYFSLKPEATITSTSESDSNLLFSRHPVTVTGLY